MDGVWLKDVDDKVSDEVDRLLEVVEVVLVLKLNKVLLTLDNWVSKNGSESNSKDDGEADDEIDNKIDTGVDSVTEELVKVEFWLKLNGLLLILDNWVLEEEDDAIAGVCWFVELV